GRRSSGFESAAHASAVHATPHRRAAYCGAHSSIRLGHGRARRRITRQATNAECLAASARGVIDALGREAGAIGGAGRRVIHGREIAKASATTALAGAVAGAFAAHAVGTMSGIATAIGIAQIAEAPDTAKAHVNT